MIRGATVQSRTKTTESHGGFSYLDPRSTQHYCGFLWIVSQHRLLYAVKMSSPVVSLTWLLPYQEYSVITSWLILQFLEYSISISLPWIASISWASYVCLPTLQSSVLWYCFYLICLCNIRTKETGKFFLKLFCIYKLTQGRWRNL